MKVFRWGTRRANAFFCVNRGSLESNDHRRGYHSTNDEFPRITKATASPINYYQQPTQTTYIIHDKSMHQVAQATISNSRGTNVVFFISANVQGGRSRRGSEVQSYDIWI